MEMEQSAPRPLRFNLQIVIALLCVLIGTALLVWTFVLGPRVVKPQLTPFDVVSQFKAAGLEAENSTPMAQQDYGLAPFVCTGERFLIPSLGADQGGRVFICENTADRDALKSYYDGLGKQSPALSSWVMIYNRTLVQINGDLPEDKARRYESVIRSLP